jgi:hypothetical protein
MKRKPTLLIGGACLAAGFAQAVEFDAPVRLEAGGKAIRTEDPGYAAPCWADIDGDGDADLLVGQFRRGRIKVYLNQGGGIGNLAEGEWLKVDGKPVIVPGVW